jgi:peptidylprolyl isomerase
MKESLGLCYPRSVEFPRLKARKGLFTMRISQTHKTFLAAVLAISAIAVSDVSHGATKPKPTPTATRKATQVTQNLPSVSAQAGVAPVIGKPEGGAPTTLVSKDIIVGHGAQATSTSTVTAHYVLMSWKTGQIIQSSWSQGPATFPLSQVIPGWQQGIPGMKVGGRRLLVIPPALAYGPNGSGPIGPNETLLFVVDLTAVK